MTSVLHGKADKLNRKAILSSTLPARCKRLLLDALVGTAQKKQASTETIYTYFRASEFMPQIGVKDTAAEYRRKMTTLLQEPLQSFDPGLTDTVLLFLAHAQSMRDSNFVPLYNAFAETEYHRGGVR